jgi:hypothetical protein
MYLLASAAFALFNLYGNANIKSWTVFLIFFEFFCISFLLNVFFVKTKSIILLFLIAVTYVIRKTFSFSVLSIPIYLISDLNHSKLDIYTVLFAIWFDIFMVLFPAIICLISKKKKRKKKK